MPQSLAQICLPIVYSTKHRQPFLKDEALLTQAHAYLAEVCGNLDLSAPQLSGSPLPAAGRGAGGEGLKCESTSAPAAAPVADASGSRVAAPHPARSSPPSPRGGERVVVHLLRDAIQPIDAP